MTSPQPRWVDPNPPSPIKAGPPKAVVVSGAILAAAIVVLLIAVALPGRRSGDADHPAGEVVLIAADGLADEPFTRSLQLNPVVISDSAAQAARTLLQRFPVSAARKVRIATGLTANLYGTTGDASPCDVVALANILDAKPAVAQLWSKAIELTPQQIPFYLNTLTAVVLLDDFWVTMHSPQDDALTADQVILQAGTAVLIDPLGVPRVRCASGSPLTPPADHSIGDYRFVGEPWERFASEDVLTVGYSAAGSGAGGAQWSLVDVTDGQPVIRKVGQSIDLGGASVPLPDPAAMNVPPGQG